MCFISSPFSFLLLFTVFFCFFCFLCFCFPPQLEEPDKGGKLNQGEFLTLRPQGGYIEFRVGMIENALVADTPHSSEMSEGRVPSSAQSAMELEYGGDPLMLTAPPRLLHIRGGMNFQRNPPAFITRGGTILDRCPRWSRWDRRVMFWF